VVQRNFAGPSTPSTQQPGETVTVARAQSLISYGKTIGVDWRLLVKLNNLRPPYLVFPGQVIKLK
jgi:LysM repeat protein